MKLYFSPGACSLAPHLLLHESGLPFTSTQVNLRDKTYDGGDFRKINPKGYVPTLELDNKEILTENAVILQYIADQKPAARLIPAHGTLERYRSLETLHFIATEIHKTFSPLYDPTYPEEMQKKNKEKIALRFDQLNTMIDKDHFAMGKDYGVVDPYLFTMMTWAQRMKFEVSRWPRLLAHYERVRNRPATAETLKKEGLDK